MTRIPRYALWTVVALALLLAAAVTVLRFVAPFRQAEADRQWAESFESMDALRAKYASAPDSAAALKLAVLARPIGIPLARSETSSVDKTPALIALARFVNEWGRKADDGPAEPPAGEVAEFLSRTRAEVDAIEAHLLADRPVTWAIDLRDGQEQQVPPLSGLRSLGDVLLARAIAAAGRGDAAAARRSLNAAERLTLTVRDRPEMISQLILAALLGRGNAVMRRLPVEALASVDPPVRDWKAAMLRAYQTEVLVFSASVRSAGPAPGGEHVSLRNRLMRYVLVDLSLADYSAQMYRMAVQLRSADPCALDAEAFSKDVERWLPRWNIIGQSAMSGLSNVWIAAAQIAFDDELTRLVLRAKTRASAAALPARVASGVCSSVNWTIETLAGGDVQIATDRQPFARPVASTFRVHRPAR